jgi:hypothetical protein
MLPEPMPGTWFSQLAGRLHGIEESWGVWVEQPANKAAAASRRRLRLDFTKAFMRRKS